MENKMKKLVRQLSTRAKAPRPTVATGTGSPSNEAESPRKSSLTSPIPPNTVIHFPKCPHTTPPTPRPACMPSVLRTQIIVGTSFPAVAELATGVEDLEVTDSSHPPSASASASESREAIVPAGIDGLDQDEDEDEDVHERERESERDCDLESTSPTTATGTAATEESKSSCMQIKKYLSTPARCLDCSLSLAREREAYTRDFSAARLRECELRLVELSSAAKAVCQVARIKNAEPGRSDGHLLKEDVAVLDKIEAEETVLREEIADQTARVEREVQDIWADVQREWEGGIREIVRGDGTGEAEEKCVFVVRRGEADPTEEEELDGLQVQWVPNEG